MAGSDYGTNDQKKHMEIGILRSTTESFVRLVYTLPKKPALIRLAIFRSAVDGDAISSRERNGILPIAKLYNYSLISYMSAVWPAPERPFKQSSGLFDHIWIHLMWYVHQIIADLFAFSWAAAELALETDFGIGPVNTTTDNASFLVLHDAEPDVLPTPMFHNGAISRLSICEEPLTKIAHPGLYDAPLRPVAPGWEFINHTHKEGWQFSSPNATENNRTVKYAFSGNLTAFEKSDQHQKMAQMLTLPPISFRMQFSERAQLSVSYLQSYENFGRAVITFDMDIQHAERAIVSYLEFFEKCKQESAPPLCKQHLLDFEIPFVLDGYWTDHSSQTSTSVFLHGYAPAVVGITPPDAFVITQGVPLVSPGWHTVSIWYIEEESSKRRPRFKFMDLKSC